MFRRIEVIYRRGHEAYVPFNDATWKIEQMSWGVEWVKFGLNSLGPALHACGVKAPDPSDD